MGGLSAGHEHPIHILRVSFGKFDERKDGYVKIVPDPQAKV